VECGDRAFAGLEQISVRVDPERSRSSFPVCIGLSNPAGIALLSLFALVFWDNVYDTSPEQQQELRVAHEEGEQLTLEQAKQRLLLSDAVLQHETKLSEAPLWFSVDLSGPSAVPQVLELPSRHVVNMKCWDGATGNLLGGTGEEASSGSLRKAKAGYALKLDQRGQTVVCRAQFQGPAKLTAFQWSERGLDISEQDFQRKSGLLDGGMLVLATFVLLTALINRQSLYLIFAAWLLVTLRISTTSAGWDTHWLNHAFPQDWLAQSRSIARGVWAILTVTLYKALLREELKQIRSAFLVHIAQWLCLALLLVAFVLPRDLFLKVMWLLGTGALALLLVSWWISFPVRGPLWRFGTLQR